MMVVDFTQSDNMRIEADDLIGQGIESPRHDRSVAPDIELKHPQFAGFSADAADTA